MSDMSHLPPTYPLLDGGKPLLSTFGEKSTHLKQETKCWEPLSSLWQVCVWEREGGRGGARFHTGNVAGALLATCSLWPRPNCLFSLPPPFFYILLSASGGAPLAEMANKSDAVSPIKILQNIQIAILWKNQHTGIKIATVPAEDRREKFWLQILSSPGKLSCWGRHFFLQVLLCIVKHNSPCSKRVWVAK